MATTKIRAIKDSLSRVVDYAANPEKTTFSDLKQVLLYAENEDKTIDEDEKTMYVTGVNCNKETAFEEMSYTQKKYDKCDGNVAYHAYQSFKTGEVSPELAHKIGVELAQKMWGEYQVIVATHFNTGTYHNHFVVCSVNMFTGKKFNCNKGAYYRFRGLSDELCAENNLIVIEKPKGKTPRNIYFAEKRGEPTKYNLMKKAIDDAMEMCVNYAQFKKIMYKKGYIINDDPNRKYATIRSINGKKATRMYQLGEQYTPKKIAEKVNRNPYYMQNGYLELFKKKRPKRYQKYKYKGKFKNMSKITGIEVLFLLLFYLLGFRPRENEHQRHKPLSPEMKEAVRKLDRYSNQVRLVSKEKLRTIEDVKGYIEQTEKDIADITETRQKYRNKLRNCTDEQLIAEYKSKKVKDNEEMEDLIESIKKYGIIEPLIVRKRDKGGYEIISGHRRKYACEKAGIKQIPVLIRDMDKNLATITVVDSNLQRQDILPSEKAFAFKMKLEAEKHQGRTSGQDVQKWTRDNITDNMSGRQVQRYVRLTELIPELLKLVDDNKMAMSPAVEISYLKKQEQKDLLETIESEDCTPSYPQAMRMRELSKNEKLDMDTIFSIMTEQKPNQKEQIKFEVEKLKDYFPKGYSIKQMEDTIEKLLKQYKQRWKNRDLER